MQPQYKILFCSILIGSCLTMILTLIPIWQLVLIAPLLTGFLNKRLSNSLIAGVSSILIAWSVYALFGMITRNIYSILDQLSSLILGEGFAWILITIIFLTGILFGILGAALGNRLFKLSSLFLNLKKRNPEKTI